MRRTLVALFTVAAVVSGPLAAQTPPPRVAPGLQAQQAQQFPQIDLTEEMVNGLLESLPALKALAGRYNAKAPPASEGPVGVVQGLAVTAAAQADLNATVGKYGFGDYQTWVIVAQNVFSTFTWVKMGDVQQQMAGALAAIENNPQLTRQQKDMMRAQFSGANTAMAAQRPSENNIALISRLANDIEAQMQAMSGR